MNDAATLHDRADAEFSEQEIVEAWQQVGCWPTKGGEVYGPKPCPICSGDHHLSEHIPAWFRDVALLSPPAFNWVRETAESIERYRHYVIKQNQELKALRDENHTLRLEKELLEGIRIHLESYLNEVGGEGREPW